MELLVFILLACIGLGIFLRSASEKRLPPKSTPRANRPADAANAPRAFDPNSAKTVPSFKELKGPAYVIDGDTIRVCKTQIRLFGIDAPEMNHPYGKAAKWAMVGLCKGQSIRAEILERDVHGRTVAKCFLPDGRDLSAELVKQGLAIDWPKNSGGTYTSLEVAGVRKKLWLADARQKGRMHVWEQFERRQTQKSSAG
ncbi:MAG: thermonuclease family protein [Pseudomonadota bacterium]